MTNQVPYIIWPDNPLPLHGGLYPHRVLIDGKFLNDMITGYLRSQRLPQTLRWDDLCNMEYTTSYNRAISLGWWCDGEPDWVTWFMLRRTLEITCEPKPGSPAWQNMRVYYHSDPFRWSNNKPRMTCSLTYFLQRYFKLEVTDAMLKEVYGIITGDMTEEFSSQFTFVIKDGTDDDAPEVFTHVYTHPKPGTCTNPSVLGSCMRYETWDTDFGTIGRDFPHPSTVYAVRPLALAYLHDSDGLTVARALVNMENKQFHRVYSWAPSNTDSVEVAASKLADYFSDLLRGEGYSRGDDVLKGVALRINPIPRTDLCVAPYIDGEYQCFDGDVISDAGYLWRYHNPPIQQYRGEECYCESCGESILPLPENYCENDGNYYCSDHMPDENTLTCCNCGESFSEDDDHWIYDGEPLCQHCFDNNYGCCAACGDVIHESDTMYAEDDRWCNHCFDRRFVICTHCGDSIRIGSHYETPDGEHCCSDCFYDRYQTCNNCDTTYDSDDVIDGLCPECRPQELEATNES